MDAAGRSASRIIHSGMRGSENKLRREARGRVQSVRAAASRRVRTVARMIMDKWRRQRSGNFLTRRGGNLPTSKITWYKRSPSFRRRAPSWPIQSWQVTCNDYWKRASGWKKHKTKWNNFMHVGLNWRRKRNEPRSEGII